MISSKEYSQLIALRINPNAIDNDMIAIQTFGKEQFIEYNVVSFGTFNGYVVTPKGERAIEEYEAFLDSSQNEKETLYAAREANEIAREANTIAKHSKNLSIWAIVVSVISALGTIVGVIISACIK